MSQVGPRPHAWTVWLAIASLMVSIAGTVIASSIAAKAKEQAQTAKEQAQSAKEQAQTSKEQAQTAKEQAQAAKEQAETAKEALATTQASLAIHVSVDSYNDPSGATQLRVSNAGLLPIRSVFIYLVGSEDVPIALYSLPGNVDSCTALNIGIEKSDPSHLLVSFVDAYGQH